MSLRTLWLAAVAALPLIFLAGKPNPLQGQSAVSYALQGQVSSLEEGPMEGVLVSAQRKGSTVTVTVVSDAQGRYSFPANRLSPGQYSLRIRAVGYDLDDPGPVEIAAHHANAVDLRLKKTQNLAAQLTNAEWILSAPGTDAQKTALLNCVNCHTLQRIVRSGHDAAEFLQVFERMGSYANQSFPLHPQRRLATRALEVRGDELQQARQRQAEFLSSINLSGGSGWQYELKKLPRPTGRATRVIITEYDLPRPVIEPHDVILDSAGMVWHSNFGEQTIGKLDPKTAEYTEYPVPVLKPGWPTGNLGLKTDPDGNLWFGMMYQGGIAKLDRKTGKIETRSLPPEFNKDNTQVNMVGPQSLGVDGKVWHQNNGIAAVHRVDLASGKVDTFQPFKGSTPGENHNIYDVIPDSKNNLYFTDFAQMHIGRIDAQTGQVKLFPTPTRNSAPRRGQMDAQDRIWFGEYRGNKIGMFDTKTEQFQEWAVPTPWSAPYDVAMDKNGELWTGSMTTDRVARLDPQSGQFVEYLLPRSTNIRRAFVDNTSTPVTFWVGNNHGASILKLEPLD